jgi:hypothetical protein
MGFRPPELSPRVESKHPFGAPALLPLAAANGSASRLRTKRGSVAGAPLFRNHTSSLLSWAFIPSRVFPSSAIRPQKSPSSHDLIHSRLTVSSVDGLQSLTRGKVGLALSSLPTLLGSCASTLDHLLLFRPCRNHFCRPLHPINDMSGTASAALPDFRTTGCQMLRRRTRATRIAQDRSLSQVDLESSVIWREPSYLT